MTDRNYSITAEASSRKQHSVARMDHLYRDGYERAQDQRHGSESGSAVEAVY